MRQNRPSDTRMLCCQRHRSDIRVSALLQAFRPVAFVVGLLVHQAQTRLRTEHQKLS
jgi:hypothetical protein